MTTYIEVIGIGSCGPIYRVQENEELYVLKYSAAPSPLEGIPHHPNVIQFHHQSRTDQGWKILYKDSPGIDLEQILRRTSLPDCTDIILQLCRGLEHLHEQGIMHRDLKPSNVVLSTDGEVFIIDCERSKEKNIHVSRIIGHEPYIAPETQKTGEYSAASDIYALGMILKSLLTSQQETNIQRYKQIITMCSIEAPEKRPTLSQIIRLLPSQTESIRPWAKANIPKLCAQRKEYFSTHILPNSTTGVQKTSASLWLGLICLLCATIYALQEKEQSHEHPVIKTIPIQARVPIEQEESFQIEDSVPNEAPKVQLRTEGSPPKSQKISKSIIGPEREYRISSIPWGAKVWIDNLYIGRTIIRKIPLKEGAHTVTVEYNNTKMRKTLHFDDTHTGYIINIEQNHWKRLSGQ